MSQRLNARIDDELAEKLAVLQRRTGKNVTEIVKESIAAYYEQTRGGPERALHQIRESGFVGCGESDADLSSTYKQRLSELLGKKGQR
ncbi:MAG TPA: ribbon-helix-helix domain-containing protein [Terriglobales bacterium]|nr:ribbon-helix-helix domain-containing protein [Terriglobales bacterium]